ncbi:nucleobase:cation symporter-2 family protein [Streptococcus intermedius]|uniref:nucleobase:cation symporter-2 family protein n=1 Tax=Streptococcus intermedius TaxID=1338 RepID=UPI00029BB26D|nr:nucleobase:cation symporter-2 family protein [Streptococcus intermedius]AGU77983.1 xanthine permease [Streptococcus intermedius C270]EKU17229.1 xanthine permease family protein [Streptococcus intermedius BA1]RSJ11541.1 Uric acid permease PucK [Streptococcus intermedius]RSJ17660.1 Uric acid permease PucK [Streptococcus intermedius]RSJ32835.1 Uric acid permease PucK [Streptococcus intermedius]
MNYKEKKHSQAAILGLQHLLAMYSGSILVPIMIASALGYSSQQLTYLISTDIFMCGVATFLQLQLNKYFGIGLPVVLGVAFQSVAPLIMIGQKHGSGAMFGALIVSGVYVLLIAGFCSKIANFFPAIVTGSVITTIGLTLIPVAIGNMGNNSEKPTAQSLLLAAVTILIILLVNIFAKGFLKSIAILIGLMVGTIVASCMGLVDFTPVTQAPLMHVPTPFYFGIPKFEFSSIIMMCIIATVSLVESTGVYFALSDISKETLDSTRLRNGYRAEGIAVLLGGIFNTFPYTGFSQNVGLVKLSGIKTRLPIYYAASFLILLGLLPKFGALAQIIPSPVLGGAMLIMFGFVSVQGMQILARVDFEHNEHDFLIAAVSISAGVGLNGSNLFNSLPTGLQMFFSNGIVMASVIAIALNLILNHKKK